MDPATLFLGGALIVAALLFLFSSNGSKSRLPSEVSRIPGPPVYPIVGSLLPVLFLKRNEMFDFYLKTYDKYKPIWRTSSGGSFQIHLTRPEHVEPILRSSEHLDKGHVYSFLHQWLGTGLLTSTGQKWHTHRKIITPTFHFNILDSFLKVFSENSEILVRKLQKEVGSEAFNIYPYITKCALDIICETAMGTSMYAQDERGSDYVKAVYGMSEMWARRTLTPWLHSEFMFKMSQYGRRHNECLSMLHGFTRRVIQDRRKQLEDLPNGSPTASADEDASLGKKRRKAFLDLLLEASDDGMKLTDEELREEVDTFMFEGHDTTSAGMCWTLFLLGLHPDVQEKVYQEQASIFQGSDCPPTMKDLNNMKYLERVIKESLRLYPSVPVVGRKLNKDVKIGNYTLPGGCTVLIHIYSIHRNPDQFPNPEKFDPDNFLPERVAKRHPYAYIPFSAGPRNCIGQKFALLEEKTVLSYLLRHYELRSHDTRENVTLLRELVLRPEEGIRLSIEPRTACDSCKTPSQP